MLQCMVYGRLLDGRILDEWQVSILDRWYLRHGQRWWTYTRKPVWIIPDGDPGTFMENFLTVARLLHLTKTKVLAALRYLYVFGDTVILRTIAALNQWQYYVTCAFLAKTACLWQSDFDLRSPSYHRLKGQMRAYWLKSGAELLPHLN